MGADAQLVNSGIFSYAHVDWLALGLDKCGNSSYAKFDRPGPALDGAETIAHVAQWWTRRPSWLSQLVESMG